jgi:hypothetical protein
MKEKIALAKFFLGSSKNYTLHKALAFPHRSSPKKTQHFNQSKIWLEKISVSK